jgi:uncharacterized phage protein gp47/JayE
MASQFNTPEFLQNYSVDDVYETMRGIIPADIDSSEGSHTWNFLRPTALIIAEVCEFVLPQVVQLIFPEWSYGEFLDAHAQVRGMSRKQAVAATGEVTITGTTGTVIPEGSVFSTASLNNEDPSVSYATKERAEVLNNLLDQLTPQSQTINGLTFTANGNGSITINGTATAATTYKPYSSGLYITEPAILSGVTAGSNSTYYMRAITANSQTPYTVTTTGVTIQGPTYIGMLWIYVANGVQMDNVTITPLLQYATPRIGSVTVPIECTEAGTIGNAAAESIILVSSSLQGISGVINAEATTGGTDEETDDDLIERIMEYDQTQGDSFVGNIQDYKRWALSVTGIGGASVIPANDSTGLVTIVVTDSNGDPASEDLCTDVYNYIMSPDNQDARLAPINANLSVVAPTVVNIGIQATVELTDEVTVQEAIAEFYEMMMEYLPAVADNNEVRISRVGTVLSSTEGVLDYSSLQIGVKSGGTITWGTSNIELSATEIPAIAAEDITLNGVSGQAE